VGDLEQRPYVSPVVRLDSALEGLDVLLRHHRSRSIPPRGGGCQSKTALSEDRRAATLAPIKRDLQRLPCLKANGPRGKGDRSLDKALIDGQRVALSCRTLHSTQFSLYRNTP
jgi:hypothetical protein